MISAWIKRSPFLIVIFLFVLAECLVNPLGEFPLNDDWSYTKSVLILTNEGRLDIGLWPAMTLVTHLVWGGAFVKVFGFSFFILRLSNMISALIALYTLYRLTSELVSSTWPALLASLALLFNPVFFNLSNTYMTDVSFITLMLLAIFSAKKVIENPTSARFIGFGLVCVPLVLLRQYGILLPLSFLGASLFCRERRLYLAIGSVAVLVFSYFSLKFYEGYLQSVLPPEAAYKFSGKLGLFTADFWIQYWNMFVGRYKIIFTHATVYTFPVVAVFLPSLIKNTTRKFSLVSGLALSVGVYFLLRDHTFQVGNVFNEMAVGADTSYETLFGSYGEFPHYYEQGFTPTLHWIMMLFTWLWCWTVAMALRQKFGSRPRTASAPFTLFVLAFLIAYAGSTLLTESFFDRYQLPCIVATLILLLILFKGQLSGYSLPLATLLLFAYVAIAGTHDYFTVNRLRWNAYHELTRQGIETEKINGGFEVNCWNEGKYSWWSNFMVLDYYDYLIQYRKEEQFESIKAMPFRRYLPLKKDTLHIYKRQ